MFRRWFRICRRQRLIWLPCRHKLNRYCTLLVIVCLMVNSIKLLVLFEGTEPDDILSEHSTRFPGVYIRVESKRNLSSVKLLQLQPSLQGSNLLYLDPNSKIEVMQVNRSQCGVLTPLEKRKRGKCEPQMKKILALWTRDPIYRAQGVDGNLCCIHKYASQIDSLCPSLRWFNSYKLQPNNLTIPLEEANLRVSMEDLLKILQDSSKRKVFAFARLRVIRNWDNWRQGALNLATKQNMDNRIRKRILVYPGVMTKRSKTNFVENQFRGAPLGEITQWTDLITVLYILGHNMTICSEFEHLLSLGQPVERNQRMVPKHTECPLQQSAFDLIYTDIIGLNHIKLMMGAAYKSLKCMLRIVDSFGTEAPYNDEHYAKSHRMQTFWGQQNLHLQQFNTLYPHTPENSFLGFVVERNGGEKSFNNITTKEDIALIYAKDQKMWKNMTPILDVVSKHLTVHATVNSKKASLIPKYVVNHGVLPGDQLHKLLKRIKLFVGFPTSPKEGPGPLEAIGYGAVFLNPAYKTPLNYNQSKPTSRTIASINPYAEHHIGKPHVYTVNMSRLQDVENAVVTILNQSKFEPYMAYEFTHEGMLQRVNSYLVHQDFCSDKPKEKWPPRKVVTLEFAESGMSCKDFCWKKGKLCELAYFDEANNPKSLADSCSHVSFKDDDYLYPIREEKSKNCTLQKNPWLFGCAGSRPSFRRFCPCRTYVRGQSALCPGCE